MKALLSNADKVLVALMATVLFFVNANNAQAQLNSFGEIKEVFLKERPQTGDPVERSLAIQSLDQLSYANAPSVHPGTRDYMLTMIQKAVLEIKNEVVTEGASVWLLYNHGFVVKTPTVCLGFDLFDYYYYNSTGSRGYVKLADILDMYFISHAHRDHYSENLIKAMHSRGKPVIGPKSAGNILLNTHIGFGDTLLLSNVHIVAHYGEHSIPVRQYEVTTPEGIRILHTGDNSSISTLPSPEYINLLLINCWIEGWGGHLSPYSLSTAIKKVNPEVTLPGHFMELRHFRGDSDPLHWDDGAWVDLYEVPGDYHVLTWGERYHFDDSSNDTVCPNVVENAGYQFTEDSLNISWEKPKNSVDGESAAFYRIIMNNSEEYFLRETGYSMPWDTIGKYPVKIFAYDACGNQGPVVAFNATTPDINFTPRIIRSDPGIGDTMDVFVGVKKVFNIEAYDPNNDALNYLWKLNDQIVQEGMDPTYVFHHPDLEPGHQTLSVNVSDNQVSRQITWQLYHHDRGAIIDNSDTLMFSASHHWDLWSEPAAFYGTFNYCYVSFNESWARYDYYPPVRGQYDLYVYIPGELNGLSLAVYNILINDQPVDTITFFQNDASGTWAKLGSYYLPEVSEASLRITNYSMPWESFIVADAVRFDYMGPGTNAHERTNTRPQIRIYPNPFNTAITIESQEPTESVTIFNSAGIIIGRFDHVIGWIDPGDLEPGVYFIRIVDSHGEIYLKKLLKE
jgi:L-ascorbate metabolism protein UlaG (beta-lactamase superfamily)